MEPIVTPRNDFKLEMKPNKSPLTPFNKILIFLVATLLIAFSAFYVIQSLDSLKKVPTKQMKELKKVEPQAKVKEQNQSIPIKKSTF